MDKLDIAISKLDQVLNLLDTVVERQDELEEAIRNISTPGANYGVEAFEEE